MVEHGRCECGICESIARASGERQGEGEGVQSKAEQARRRECGVDSDRIKIRF